MKKTPSNSRALEEGSATIWAVGFICLLVALVAGIAVLNGALAAKARAQTGADFAALAAASAHFYGSETSPCVLAEQVAHQNQVALDSCELGEKDVRVQVSVIALSNWQVSARSRAGPVKYNWH
ncbi:MAG: Rv3654c family TadE-like protein [Varibaculum timonense]